MGAVRAPMRSTIGLLIILGALRRGISFTALRIGSRSAETLHEVDEKGNNITATLVPFSDQMSDNLCS